MIRIAGIVLLVVGLIGLAVGTFQYTRTKRVLDAGPIRNRPQGQRDSLHPAARSRRCRRLGLALTVIAARRK